MKWANRQFYMTVHCKVDETFEDRSQSGLKNMHRWFGAQTEYAQIDFGVWCSLVLDVLTL